jgi:two-component system response regulator MprA
MSKLSNQDLSEHSRAVGQPRVLVVEDDQSLREVIAEALLEDGYLVDAATNGQAGLELARQSPPDLVILDLMMPRMDGEEFCLAVRQIEPLASVPIIVVSAARSVDDAGLRLGASASLRKPFDLFELAGRVNALLR